MARQRDQELLQTVGGRVAKARRDRGWTQETLAEAIGIEPVTLSRLETGDRALSLSTLSRITEILGVSLGDLLDQQRELPVANQPPDLAELSRLFATLAPARRDLLLRMARELAVK